MDRWLCGWRVSSDLPLPDLLRWTGDDRPPDLEIRLGKGDCDDARGLWVAPDGACRLAIDGVASYHVDAAGRQVTVFPSLEPSAPDIRLFLLGTVFGIVCLRHGLVPLHASCVRIGDRAVAVTGPSGSGKSTLAAAFLRRGHEILADDVTVLDLSGAVPVALPAFPRLKLWRASMDAFGVAVAGRERVRAALDKYQLPLDTAFAHDPLPLAAVYHLEEEQEKRAAISPLKGVGALAATMEAVYQPRLAPSLGLSREILRAVGAIAAAVPSFRLGRRRALDEVDGLAACVLHHAEGLG